ncbi:hypothetical protein AB0K60_18810 [Thermopolyspora sp. NPDC052614]|uniref:hypothetical protein n=1 Tax=Thermopolyspora sp. NPDC052614 TaxID=3155682 RepID=UPI00341216DE
MSGMVSGLAAARAELVMTEPAIPRRMLHLPYEGQTRLAEALSRDPDGLDLIDAAALVGALFGAVNAAFMTALHRGDPLDRVREAMTRAAALRPASFAGNPGRHLGQAPVKRPHSGR